ncbi:MAG: hypothetical protein ACUZ8E_07910 [Candidatus Anammoxibacter sp.]
MSNNAVSDKIGIDDETMLRSFSELSEECLIISRYVTQDALIIKGSSLLPAN